MKNKFVKICAFALALLFAFSGCSFGKKEESGDMEEFSYEMLDLKTMVDNIYNSIEINELTKSSIERITDETVLSEQYYLDLDNVISCEVRSAEGKFGVADIAVIRVVEGATDEVLESLERRKDDRINEFSKYDVYDSYDIALNAEVYYTGELVVMLMLPEKDRTAVRDMIQSYLP